MNHDTQKIENRSFHSFLENNVFDPNQNTDNGNKLHNYKPPVTSNLYDHSKNQRASVSPLRIQIDTQLPHKKKDNNYESEELQGDMYNLQYATAARRPQEDMNNNNNLVFPMSPQNATYFDRKGAINVSPQFNATGDFENQNAYPPISIPAFNNLGVPTQANKFDKLTVSYNNNYLNFMQNEILMKTVNPMGLSTGAPSTFAEEPFVQAFHVAFQIMIAFCYLVMPIILLQPDPAYEGIIFFAVLDFWTVQNVSGR